MRSSSEARPVAPRGGRAACILFAVLQACAIASPGSGQEPSALSESYGSWTYQCRAQSKSAADDATRVCQVSQELRQSQDGRRILSAVFSRAPYKITLVAPFGLLLTEGTRLSVSEAELPAGRFKTCLPSVGCISEHFLEPRDVEVLRASEVLTVLMVSSEGQEFQVNLDMNGFGNASKRLEDQQ